MSKQITLSPELKLPADAVTQTWLYVGRKGSGKTYAAGVMVEAFLEADVQVVVLDPVGNWFGLRLDKSGKKPSGFDVPILGGSRGDVSLETTGGPLVADTIVDTGTSAVLDVSHFRKAERKRFVADFAEQLFHRKKTHKSPLHLVIEEAQLFAPQMAKGEERMLGAIEDLVRLGRNYGIGCTMISQRPQSINTEVRNQCEPLVVFQLVAKHERDAIAGWMQHMGVDAKLEQLSTLKTGDCFFWSPAWMEKFIRTRYRAKQTFDASSTPTVGGRQATSPGKLKQLDLSKLKTAMAATIERAKADDPKELRKKIAELEAANKKLAAGTGKAAATSAPKDGPSIAVLQREFTADRKVLLVENETLVRSYRVLREKLVDLLRQAEDNATAIDKRSRDRIQAIAKRSASAPAIPPPRPPATSVPPAHRSPSPEAAADDRTLTRMERALLIALAQHPTGLTKRQILTHADYSSNGATSAAFARFNREAWTRQIADRVEVTLAGLEVLGSFEPLPVGAALRESILAGQKTTPMEKALLRVLFEVYPNAISKGAVLESANYSSNGATSAAFARFVTLGWAEKTGPSFLRAADELFQE